MPGCRRRASSRRWRAWTAGLHGAGHSSLKSFSWLPRRVVRGRDGTEVGVDSHAVDGEGQAAEQLGPTPELALHPLGKPAEPLQRTALERVPQGGEQDLAGLGELTADD